ncbi:MAG TPA: antibiotic biosynthesis monooxygenase [Bacteroidales bacterium]|nr:antibiotic biosynthesis monooxygenase [Bacteroidales bacterium]
MITTIVHVKVKSQFVKEFIDATIANHEESTKEPGNVRFDILQKEDDPTSFALYEAYESEEQARAHKQTAHYFKWRDTVADWMEIPRLGVKYSAIRP